MSQSINTTARSQVGKAHLEAEACATASVCSSAEPVTMPVTVPPSLLAAVTALRLAGWMWPPRCSRKTRALAAFQRLLLAKPRLAIDKEEDKQGSSLGMCVVVVQRHHSAVQRVRACDRHPSARVAKLPRWPCWLAPVYRSTKLRPPCRPRRVRLAHLSSCSLQS